MWRSKLCRGMLKLTGQAMWTTKETSSFNCARNESSTPRFSLLRSPAKAKIFAFYKFQSVSRLISQNLTHEPQIVVHLGRARHHLWPARVSKNAYQSGRHLELPLCERVENSLQRICTSNQAVHFLNLVVLEHLR